MSQYVNIQNHIEEFKNFAKNTDYKTLFDQMILNNKTKISQFIVEQPDIVKKYLLE